MSFARPPRLPSSGPRLVGHRPAPRRPLGCASLLLAAGCYSGVGADGQADGSGSAGQPTDADGTDGTADTGGDDSPSAACVGSKPGDQVIRRLSNGEYNQTLRDLFGAEVISDDALLPYEGDLNGFTNDVSRLTVAWPDVQAYLSSTELVARDVQAALPTLLPCAATADDDATRRACATEFIAEFGPRIFRRPLADGETEQLLSSYDDALAMDAQLGLDGGLPQAIGFVVMRALQAPDFLYRLELGGEPLDDLAMTLTSWEMASRLSYLLWGSMPDDALFDAAAADALRTPEEVAAQVDRMLLDPRARTRVRLLFREWLHLGAVASATRDSATWPDFDGIKGLLTEQAERFGEHVVFDGDARDVRELLTSPSVFLNAQVAPLYGVDPSGLTDAWVLTDLPAEQRSGLFTHAAVLAPLAKPNEPAPVLRGKFLLEQLFCQTPPPPPPDVMMTTPPPESGATTRARWEAVTEVEGSTCLGCHQVINAPGHALGHYDAVGGYITDENGNPIDASGSLTGVGIDADFADAIEMFEIAAEDPGVRACIVQRYFQFSYGRPPLSDQDECTFEALTQRFAETEGDLRDLLVAMTTTDAFLYRAR